MAIYRGPGGPGDAVADAASEAALISALVTQAQTAETNAGNSASAASVSANNAANSASTAATAATNAANSATSAAASVASIGTSVTDAANSATAAASSASAAATSATNSASSATAASSSASAASSSASSASTSATNAANSASAAATSASNAASSASTASTAATNASNSATAASTSASNAATSETNAASSASAASTSASNAATSATNASNSASAASTSASNAATSETNAANSASAAATSATNASNSASSAATSATNAAASYDSFDDRYLGAKSSAPTLDNDGDALLTGALYWNTVGNQLYVWDGSAWDAAAFNVSGGSVTSVAMTVPTGLTVSGSPITSTGTLAVSYSSGYAIPTTVKQSNWDDSYTFVSNFPTQTGNSGKYLTTNGSTLSWGTLNTANWDTAYSWGNHATAGYLTSYTETDPVVGAINGIVKANGSGTISAATAGTDYLAPAAIGVTVQAYDAGLQSISGLTTAADKMIYTTASDTYAVTTLTAAGRAILDDADAAAQRTTLGLGTVATLNSISLTTNVTGTLPIANGGSGQTTAQAAMNTFAGAVTSGSYLRGNGTNVVMSTIQAADVPTLNQNTTGSAATLTTARTIQTNLASTLAASFNGSANITPGVTGTLPVGNGGTGATTLTGVIKGNGTSAFSAATAGTDFVAPGTATTFTAQQTFKELKDTVHTITDGAAFEIDPANGSIQVVTLGANRTPAATNFEAGQVVLLGIDDGAAYTITWTTINPTWVKAGGTASAPTLATTGYTWILLWEVGTTIYATEVGQP